MVARCGTVAEWRAPLLLSPSRAHLSGVLSQLLLCPAHTADGLLQLILDLAAQLQAAHRCLWWRHPERGNPQTAQKQTEYQKKNPV